MKIEGPLMNVRTVQEAFDDADEGSHFQNWA
jgi:hypothetical protein